MPEKVVINVKNLKKYFPVRMGLMSSLAKGEKKFVHAVDNVSFDIKQGEVYSLVGESGCGKTTTGRLLTRLEDPTSGHIYFHKKDIANLKGKELKAFRRNVQMIFQDPYESLNPRLTVFATVAEPLIVHHVGDTIDEREDLAAKALEAAELKPASEYLHRYPHELSGGQRQRVAIARALVLRPEFIVADEPVSMLDVSIRSGILNLLLELREKYGIPYLFITHDLSVARYMSDRIGVMYLGTLVETGDTEKIINNPHHPYTRALLSSVPVPDPYYKRQRKKIKGDLPSPIDVPKGCRFHPRCIFAKKGICDAKDPPIIEVESGHIVKCHFAKDIPAMDETAEETLEENMELGDELLREVMRSSPSDEESMEKIEQYEHETSF